MTNNLKTLQKDLRAFAKKTKNFKYTDSAFIKFLITGMVSVASNVFSAAPDKSVKDHKLEISFSIKNLHQKVKDTKHKNSKLLKNLNLELIQLMEQGDHVTKSPWSSWQYGANYFYSGWHTNFKGKGNKTGDVIYQRDKTLRKYLAKPVSEGSSNATTLGFVYEPNAAIPINAAITPKSITKTNPNIQKLVTIASLPSFEPRVVQEPSSPIINVPNPSQPAPFNVVAVSNGNDFDSAYDDALQNQGNDDGVIEGGVAITAGNFNVERIGRTFRYNYSGYSGRADNGSLAYRDTSGSRVYLPATIGTWSNLSRPSTTTIDRNGFLKMAGYRKKGDATMLSDATFVYSRREENSSTNLGEFAHLDLHGAQSITDQTAWITASSSASLAAYNDAISYLNSANPNVTAASDSQTYINAGKITMKGGNISLTNSYNHNTEGNKRAIVINTGDVAIEPLEDNGIFGKYNAIFVVSNDNWTPNQQTLYNSGQIDIWTPNSTFALIDPNITTTAVSSLSLASGLKRPVDIVNRSSSVSVHGENSTGIYLKRNVDAYLDFTDGTDMATVGNGWNPVVIYGDKSTGLFVNTSGTTVKGYFAADIGSAGQGNKVFNGTGGLANYDINRTDDANAGISEDLSNPSLTADDKAKIEENNLITKSTGIYTVAPINLTKHQIRIYDKTKGNVGIYPDGEVAVTLGTGDILLEGGTNNTGIAVKVKGSSVTSDGTVTLSKGNANMAIYTDGLSDSGKTTQVTVKNVDTSNQTENSVGVYAKDASAVDVKEKFVINSKVTSTKETAIASKAGGGLDKSTENAGGVYAAGADTKVSLASDIAAVSPAPASELVNIKITGAEIVDSKGAGTGEYAGFGLFAENGAKITTAGTSLATDGPKIEVEGGSVALASVGANSEVVVDKGTVTYDGKGYALYSKNNGKVHLTDGKLVLKGEATGFSVDASVPASAQPIKLTGSKVDMQSDNAILMSIKNATNLSTTGIAATLLGYSGLNPSDVSTSTGNNYYKLAVLDGAKINIDGTGIDKSDSTAGSDSEVFTRRLLIQNSILNVDSKVLAQLNTTQITDIDSNLAIPVGLAVSASGNSQNRSTTGVNVANGATITVDRTDSGNGGVGAYVNYGTISNDGKIEVEKTTPNDFAVGLYATNGTQVDNKSNGTIEVGGKDSIGILGLSYRIDSKGNVVYEKFGTTGPSSPINKLGTVNITNSGKITLDGENSLGIYAKNNSLDATGTNMDYTRIGNSYTQATNKGEITMSGKNAIGMITEGGLLTNDTAGKITISGQEGVAMYGTYGAINPAVVTAQGLTTDRLSAALINKGTLELADTTGATPIIGMFTNDADTEIETSGTLNIGKKSYGIYGVSNSVAMSGGTINVGEDGVGIFATGSSDKKLTSGSDVILQSGTINVGDNQAVGVFIADDATNPLKTTVINTGTNMTVGTNAFGYVVDSTTGTDLLLGTATNKLTSSLGPDSVYAYSNDKNGYVYSNTDITTTGGKSYGLYTAGKTENYGNIDLTGGNGNVGIYSTGANSDGTGAINHGTILVGGTDRITKEYGIGMATGYYDENTKAVSNEGVIENRGTINVTSDNSIGMYATGSGSKAINYDVINISGKNATGMYIDRGAEGINYGTIKSTGTASGIKGVATVNGGYIKNYGTILITSPGGIGIYQDADSALAAQNEPRATGVNPLTLANQTGTVHGTRADVYSATSTEEKYIISPKGNLLIQNPPREPRLTINGREVALTGIDTNIASPSPAYVTAGSTILDLSLPQYLNLVSKAEVNEIGMYVDTSGVNYTNPIQGLDNLIGLEDINLIIGTEAAKYTNTKAIEIGENILHPYNEAISSLTSSGTTLNINSAGLTWLAQPVKGTTRPIETLYMVKIPYTFFTSEKDENTYNFLDGLEQRYGVEALGSRERLIFDKLNDLGKGETQIFTQSVDEMKGHQYANLQQRINATGNTLDKEFRYLRDEWRNPSKQNNKIKVFGARDEYSTDTAGIINYRSNAYGVAYVHEDEKVKMGNSIGWYAGAVTNRFKFKDIGKSREEQTMLKIGAFKTMSPKKDHNGALQWTVSGDVFAGVNSMKRRFWVVDDTFEAKSSYNSYGAALKNEIGYDIRMSEKTHLRPYGYVKMEYGKFNNIKEKSGQMRLQVKGNDYFSVKPEVGMEFKYVQPMAVRTNLSVGLTAAYENEIGKLQERNQARVGHTTAGWYNLEKEKEDRRGNGKFDLNIGVDNTRFGVTVNAGYDTKGNNVRGGIGFRAIY